MEGLERKNEKKTGGRSKLEDGESLKDWLPWVWVWRLRTSNESSAQEVPQKNEKGLKGDRLGWGLGAVKESNAREVDDGKG